MADQSFKICADCGTERSIGWFSRKRDSEDGRGDTCAPCRRRKRAVVRKQVADTVRSQRGEDGVTRVSLVDYFKGDVEAMAAHFEQRGFERDEDLGEGVFVAAERETRS